MYKTFLKESKQKWFVYHGKVIVGKAYELKEDAETSIKDYEDKADYTIHHGLKRGK